MGRVRVGYWDEGVEVTEMLLEGMRTSLEGAFGRVMRNDRESEHPRRRPPNVRDLSADAGIDGATFDD